MRGPQMISFPDEYNFNEERVCPRLAACGLHVNERQSKYDEVEMRRVRSGSPGGSGGFISYSSPPTGPLSSRKDGVN